MSKRLVYRIQPGTGARDKMAAIYQMVMKALQAGVVELELRRPAKSRDQEEKYHAMIHDIHRQCFRGYSAAGVKAVLVKQFAEEMNEAGTPLRSPGEKVWDWKSQEAVYVRPSTSDFRKGEASQFVEFLFSVGAEYQVAWSGKALSPDGDHQEAA